MFIWINYPKQQVFGSRHSFILHICYEDEEDFFCGCIKKKLEECTGKMFKMCGLHSEKIHFIKIAKIQLKISEKVCCSEQINSKLGENCCTKN
jgi:hypothetical protein